MEGTKINLSDPSGEMVASGAKAVGAVGELCSHVWLGRAPACFAHWFPQPCYCMAQMVQSMCRDALKLKRKEDCPDEPDCFYRAQGPDNTNMIKQCNMDHCH